MSERRASAIVWQDSPLSLAALQRIEHSADLHVRPKHRAAVRAALRRLANAAIHRAAFGETLSARDVAAVAKWTDPIKHTPIARRNRDTAIAAARAKGSDPCPPAAHREGAALSEWTEIQEGVQRPANRPVEHFHTRLVHRLCVCFWHLYNVEPDGRLSARESFNEDDTRHVAGGAARFVHAFYEEVGRAINRATITDPQLRGRRVTWKVRTLPALAKFLTKTLNASAGRSWMGWQVLPEGEIVRALKSAT